MIQFGDHPDPATLPADAQHAHPRISRLGTVARANGLPAHLDADHGFTLLEIMLVVTVGIVLAGMAIPAYNGMTLASKSDGSVYQVIDVLETARNLAVSERRNFRVSFTAPNRVVVQRVEVPGGALTPISTTDLESGLQFVKFPAVPDTPDAFGASAATSFTGAGPWMFTTDGSFVDSAGDPANGSVFLGAPDQPISARAVTILGATGQTRTWAWRGTAWFD